MVYHRSKNILISLILPILANCQDFLLNSQPKNLGKDPIGLGWYRISDEKLYGLAAVAAAGFIDGACEGFDFDGRVAFERMGWTDDQYSYFGSKRYEVVRGRAFKFDAYHNMDDARKYGYVCGSVLIGIGGKKVNTKFWHYAVDVGVSMLVSGFAKSRGMNWIRYGGKK